MSIYDKASLVLIPSGSKTSKVYSQKPVSGDGDFTFSRSTAATRVNADGNIEKETQNLLLQSNQFDTTWTTSSASVTSSQSGYDGSSDAWLLERTGPSAYLQQSNTSSGVLCYSIYLKKGTYNWAYVRVQGNTIGYDGVYFDLENGTNGSVDNDIIDYSIEAVGTNGWYRCSIVLNDTLVRVFIYPSETNGGVFNAGTGTIYIQDAQLEQGLVARDYIETTTAAIYGGITDNVPRLDYQGSCPALLLEPQRTNDWSHSEYVSGNTLVSSPIITENYAISPEGVINAFRIQDTTGTSFKRIAQSSGGLSVSVNSTYTQSLFVKKATSAVSSNGGVGFDYSGGTRQISYIIFDEYNGTMTALQSQSTLTLHDVEDYGDYWRFSISAKDTGNNTNLSLNIYACLSGNGTTISLGTKDWTGYGLQLESGSYATSYIPTYGSAVTRNKDFAARYTLDNLVFNPSQSWSFLYEAEFPAYTSGSAPILHFDITGTTDDIYLFANYTGSNMGINVYLGAGNGGYPFGFGVNDAGILNQRNKMCVTYDGDELKYFINGSLFNSTTGVSFTEGTTSVKFNSFGTLPVTAVGELLTFPTALTDQEAIDLTTI